MYKTSFFLLLSFVLSSMFSCDDFDYKKVAVIEDIPLGSFTRFNYTYTFDSLGIFHCPFAKSLSSIGDHDYYWTDLFDLDPYITAYTTHLGILYPETEAMNDLVSGIICPLVRTASGMDDSQNLTNTFVASQEINELLLNDVEELYKKKYGKPSYVDTTGDVFSYELGKDGRINKYFGSTIGKGVVLNWETKYLSIAFFKGFPSYFSEYDSKKKLYTDIFPLDKPTEPIIPDNKLGDTKCYSLPYIEYHLTEAALKELKIGKPKV